MSSKSPIVKRSPKARSPAASAKANKGAKQPKNHADDPATLDAHFRQARVPEAGPPIDFDEPTATGADVDADEPVAVPEPLPEIAAASDSAIAVVSPMTAEEEAELRAFDLEMRFGPSVGPSRRDRWLRAQKFGLNPPPRVMEILEARRDDLEEQMSIFARNPVV